MRKGKEQITLSQNAMAQGLDSLTRFSQRPFEFENRLSLLLPLLVLHQIVIFWKHLAIIIELLNYLSTSTGKSCFLLARQPEQLYDECKKFAFVSILELPQHDSILRRFDDFLFAKIQVHTFKKHLSDQFLLVRMGKWLRCLLITDA